MIAEPRHSTPPTTTSDETSKLNAMSDEPTTEDGNGTSGASAATETSSWKKWRTGQTKRTMPDLWQRCDGCGQTITKKALEDGDRVCPECGHHFTLDSRQRLNLLLDEDSFDERFTDVAPTDPLDFNAKAPYVSKLRKTQEQTGLTDAAVCGLGTIDGRRVAIGVTDPTFIAGSMGSVVGEKLTRLTELAHAEGVPLIIVCGSGGGARMQEGVLSLFQMAKTSAAIGRYRKAGGFFLSVLTHATMGGTMASFASLGDLIIAEPGALLGFTGPRVIQQTIKQELPAGFQTSEFLRDHGFLDHIVARPELKATIARLLEYCGDVPLLKASLAG